MCLLLCVCLCVYVCVYVCICVYVCVCVCAFLLSSFTQRPTEFVPNHSATVSPIVEEGGKKSPFLSKLLSLLCSSPIPLSPDRHENDSIRLQSK